MKKIVRKIIKVAVILIAVIIAICLTVFVAHKIISVAEHKRQIPNQRFVTVDGKNMSICVLGDEKSEHTIVLLPGLGTVSPINDFEPLSDELSKNFRVIVVEPFGYGYSDITDKPRTVENETSELKAALDASQLPGPYIFMAHSIYGLDVIKYSNDYPEDVEAVIGIDCTMPKILSYFGEEAPHMQSEALGVLCKVGVTRILTCIDPDSFISSNPSDDYSEENILEQKRLASIMAVNKNVISQNNEITNTINKTHDLEYDKNLPLLFFTTSEKEKISFFEEYISNETIQKIIAYDAPHYMHWTKSRDMAFEVNNFVQTTLR